MATEKKRRLLGQILLDGGFLSGNKLELALAEQKHTNELLGQILVRMGVVEDVEIKAALSVQEHIGNLEDAVRSAAGVRQMLGSLLLSAGHITSEQLEHAITVQQASGEKLGEVLIRLGLLKDEQLDCLLKFQQNQHDGKRSANPFRLGEILVTTGYLSRAQLDAALLKQSSSAKKLGEVLVEEGYAAPQQVNRAIHLQQRLISASLAAILSFSGLSLAGCGGGGGGSASQAPTASPINVSQVIKTNYLAVTSDNYGLLKPTFYYSSVNESFWSIQANRARSALDIDSECVIRIDIKKGAAGWPALNRTFSIENNQQYVKFPGTFLVFNGEKATGNKVESGIISFSPDSVASEYVSGSFDVVMTDYDAGILPCPQYRIKGIFSFKMGEYGPA